MINTKLVDLQNVSIKYNLAEAPENLSVKTSQITGFGPRAGKKTTKIRYCRCVWYQD